MIVSGMRPIHPGEILREEFLVPLVITPAALARALHVSATTVRGIVRERSAVTADMAIRLARYFGTTERFWMSLQSDFSLAIALAANGEQIELQIEPFLVHE